MNPDRVFVIVVAAVLTMTLCVVGSLGVLSLLGVHR